MDSLTQIVLGAAVGEATLGRRVGNRAIVWGGIAGTLPDLDVLSGLVTDPMSALVYHRAFTHSLPFAFLVAPLLGIAVNRLYGGRSIPLRTALLIPLCMLGFLVLLYVGSALMPIEVFQLPQIVLLIGAVFWGIAGVFALRQRLRKHKDLMRNASIAHWTLLFFLCVVTHPLLDCFTAYGTQFFEPFSAARLAWNTISVADPLYTLPFLLCLVGGARRGRGSGARRKWNIAGLVISSTYLLLTVVNHFNVRSVMEDTLAARNLAAQQYLVSPTLLNNVLWSATARTSGDTYYVGQYSLLDDERAFGPFTLVPGNHDWLTPYAEDRDVRILRWFSQGYYGVLPRDSGYLQVSDLRYGLIGEDPNRPSSYIFSWKVDTSGGTARVVQEFAGPQEDREEMLGDMWERLKGR